MTPDNPAWQPWLTHPRDALAVCTCDTLEVLACNAPFERALRTWGCESPDGCGAVLESQFGLHLAELDALQPQSLTGKQPEWTLHLHPILHQGQTYYQLRLLQDETYRADAYKHLFDRNVAGALTLDAETGKVINCNQAFAEMLGYASYRELRGNTLVGHFPPEYNREAYLTALRETGSLTNFEVSMVREDGTVIWCSENSYLDENGVIQATVMDITESRGNRERYATLFEHAMDAMVIVDQDRVVQANQQALTIFGGSEDDVATWTWIQGDQARVVRDRTNAELLTLKMEQALHGDQHRASAVCRRVDGTQFHAELKINSLQEEDRIRVCLTIRDVTERVLFERAIRESEERFRLLSDVAIESVAFVFEDTFLDCNEQMAKLLGYGKREQLIGKKISDYIPQADLERLRGLLSIGGPNKTEVRASSWDGQGMFLEASGSHIQYQGQEVQVMLFYDITSRKRTESQLEQSMDRFKNLVDNSPNGVFIVTDMLVKYANQGGIQLVEAEDEDDLYGHEFAEFFTGESALQVLSDLQEVREGEEVPYREIKVRTRKAMELDVGFKATLTVYDNKPSIQVTMHNLSTRVQLLQEKVRAELAEEINLVLKREIEEHKITQKKLIAAENFARNIIESSIDMIIAVDDQFRITEFNGAAQQQFGFTLEELEGSPADQLYASKRDYSLVRKSLEETGTFSGEIENITRDGKVFTCLLSASLIRNNDGEIVGSMGVSRDITELKQAEIELRESEERYRDIFDNARDFILSIDQKGELLYANNAFIQALGYGREELGTKSIYDLVPAGSLDRRRKVTSTFTGENMEVTFVGQGGRMVVAEGDASVRLLKGKPDSVRAIFRDVTATRRSEARAAEQQARLESIFESTRNMSMWTLNRDNIITACNRNFAWFMEQQFGEQVRVGDRFMESIESHIDPQHYLGELQAFKDAFKGAAKEFEVALRNQHDDTVWLQVFLNPVNSGEQTEEISCLTYDITDRKEIDQQIRDSLKEKDVLLQEVHHRVKNNLQVISSILNLQSSFVQDEGTLEILQESQNRIKSMSYIHETLYRTTDFSSIEFTDYIQNIARNLIHTYSFTTGEVKLQTRFDRIFLSLDQAIPCGLIINELVSNAMKYAFKGIDERELTIEITDREGHVRILVADNGIGLPADFRYEESDSLGVQLVYTLVEQLDGTIEVDAESGTRFLITFDKPQHP